MVPPNAVARLVEAAALGLPVGLTRPEAAAVTAYLAALEAVARRRRARAARPPHFDITPTMPRVDAGGPAGP